MQTTDKERIIEGVWTTPEIDEALEIGYKCEDLFEVYHYQNKLDKNFYENMNTFIGIKTENSGWGNLETDEEKEKFIKEFFDKEGVQIVSQRKEALQNCVSIHFKGNSDSVKILLNLKIF